MSSFFQNRLSLGILFGALALCQAIPAYADRNYDEGLKQFQKKDYKKAVAYFEQSIKSVPWESNPYYYCALAYHYMKDYKNASAKYGAIVDKFPGTQASQNAVAALKIVDPGYFKREKALLKVAEGAQATETPAAHSSEKDTGTVEGNPSRVYFSKSGRDMLVDVRVNGRGIKAVFDPTAEHCTFNRGQLQALGVTVQPGANEQRIDLQLGQVTRKNFPITVDSTAAAQPHIGQSFLEAFAYQVDNAGSWIDLQRKSGSGGRSAGAQDVPFSRNGKELLVVVDINGRSATMIFDPNVDGIILSPQTAKSVGLRVDEAEEVKPLPSEGPQRGETGWTNPDERQSGPKLLVVRRMKFGPSERQNVSVQIIESAKTAKIGADFATGWRCEVDYKTNVIHFTKR